VDYHDLELDVRRRQAELLAEADRRRLLRSLRASRRAAAWSPRLSAARALHAVADRLEAAQSRAS
jgi:hypothetical protein